MSLAVKRFEKRQWRYVAILEVLLACLGCGLQAFEAKRTYPGQTNFVVSFHEADAYDILARVGITNEYLASRIERDTSGAALLVHLKPLQTNKNYVTLVVTETGLTIIDLPKATEEVGFFDDLEKAYAIEEDYCVFSGGYKMPSRGKGKYSRLNIRPCPGCEILVLGYSDDPDYDAVRSRNPATPLFHITGKDMWVRRVFWKGSKVFLFGVVSVAKKDDHWECWSYRQNALKQNWERESKLSIPDAVDVLDFDPASPNVLCYRWGFRNKKAFLYNTETKTALEVGIGIWRDHGFFLREAVVTRIKTALEGRQVLRREGR